MNLNELKFQVALVEDSRRGCSNVLHPKLKTVSARSAIEWTATAWNPLTGCTKVSPGCQHCYAERGEASPGHRHAWRLPGQVGQPNYANGFRMTLHEHTLDGAIAY